MPGALEEGFGQMSDFFGGFIPTASGAQASASSGGIIKDPNEEIMKNITEEVYDVMNFYKDRGIFQRIARSNWFGNVTLVFIISNSFWMGYETDANTAGNVEFAEPLFMVVENIFCVFFTFEILVRFNAFKRSVDAF